MSGRAFNPQRPALYEAAATVLERGFTLTRHDLGAMAVAYGYSERFGAQDIFNFRFQRFLEERGGVELVCDMYRHRRIYRDGNIDPSQTDIDVSRNIIDEQIAASNRRRANTLAGIQ